VEVIKYAAPTEAVSHLAGVINNKLQAGKTVLWLVPGGSAIKIAAKAAKQLRPPLNGLTVTLTDERYGSIGHANSSWSHLMAAGFSANGATLQPILNGKSLSQTVNHYNQTLRDDLKQADFSIALAGMGPDGHIFGIKPGSPAINANEDVVGYDWDDYVRITPTLKMIKSLDEVDIYAVGEEKWPQFELLSKDINPCEQPAQLLKQLKKVIIFSDYQGEIK
jgi:6-phosphogluconolactonase/glucosamine-6-phosphate isomerase/deaminase